MKTTSKKKKYGIGSLVGSALFICGAPAQAQSLGHRHDWTLGAERLFGFYALDTTVELPGDDLHRDRSSVGFGYQQPIGLFDVPRLAFDYFVVPNLSIGGSLGFFTFDPDTDDDDSDEVDGFLFSPRVGYAVPFNEEWGVWPRGGLTYADREGGAAVLEQTALSLEVPFYFMPARNVGFTASILFDIGLTGETRVNGVRRDYDEDLLGVAFGIFARF